MITKENLLFILIHIQLVLRAKINKFVKKEFKLKF